MPRPIKEVTLAALPTLVTLGNAFCGLLAITYVLEATLSLGVGQGVSQGTGAAAVSPEARAQFFEYLERAVLCNLMAMVFDFLDGKVARLTGQASEFGVQVDSLSDVISFGLVPAVMFKTLAHHEFGLKPKLSLILASFHLIGALLRLARFNVEADLENDDHRSFKGLPSPAAAAGVGSMIYLYIHAQRDYPALVPWISASFPYVIAMLGILMWTKLPYVHFANVVLTETKSLAHFLIIVVLVLAVAYAPPIGIAVTMLAYALSGPILYIWDLSTGKRTVDGESLL